MVRSFWINKDFTVIFSKEGGWISMKKVVFILICIIFITIWFGSKQIVTFSSTSIVDSFPIPTTAKEVDSVAKNPNIIRYQKYKYSGADEINSINKINSNKKSRMD